MTAKQKKILKTVGKSVLAVVLGVFVVVCGYAIYFVSAFNRIGDQRLDVSGSPKYKGELQTKATYDLLSWNVGFCAYSDDYSFFMDGGTESRAFSEEAVNANFSGIQKSHLKMIKDHKINDDFDFICYQEVDFESTRSYFVDLKEKFKKAHINYTSTYAQNYDSPYIMFPLSSPHGANNSGLLTLSQYAISKANRVELPIEEGFSKYFDLDRCLSINRIPVNNGKEFILVNLHLSAYSSDGSITATQLKFLIDFCKEEYNKGNYVVCAGDFNMDLVEGGSVTLFGSESKGENWAKQIDPALFKDTGIIKYAPVPADITKAVPTCRNANRPYSEGNNVYVIDGFLASQNVKVLNKFVYDAQFKNSDHNPVVLSFELSI